MRRRLGDVRARCTGLADAGETPKLFGANALFRRANEIFLPQDRNRSVHVGVDVFRHRNRWLRLLAHLFILVRVLDADVVNPHQHLQEFILDLPQIPKRQVRIIELSVIDSLLKDEVNERLQAVVRRIVQAPAGRLDRVRQHQNPGLLRVGTRPGVPKLRLQNGRFVRVRLLNGFPVKVLNSSRAVMRRDEVHDALRQVVLLRQLQPLLHVVGDDQRAHLRLQIVMRV